MVSKCRASFSFVDLAGSRHGKSSGNGSSSFKNPRTMLDSPSLQLASPQLCLSSHALGGGVGSLARSADENTHLPVSIRVVQLE